MTFSDARWTLATAGSGTSEQAASDAVQRAYDTGQSQRINGRSVWFQYGVGFRVS